MLYHIFGTILDRKVLEVWMFLLHKLLHVLDTLIKSHGKTQVV